ncbi:MAG: hypothetical protein WBP55_09600 [Solirubrobacterales bacterium]
MFPFQDVIRDVPTDDPFQIYSWANGKIAPLVGFPANSSNYNRQVELKGLSRDGKTVFVSTAYKLTPDDVNKEHDIYELHGGQTNLLTSGTPTDETPEPTFNSSNSYLDNPSAGDRIFVRSSPFSDPNHCAAFYEYGPDGTRQLAEATRWTPAFADYQNCENPTYGGVSKDGSHFFYMVSEIKKLYVDWWPEPFGENPGCQRIHQVTDAGDSVVTDYTPTPPENRCFSYIYGDSSSDGKSVLFSTNAPLSNEDTDLREDMYIRDPAGTPHLVSAGPKLPLEAMPPYERDTPLALSSDGTRAVFVTHSPLSLADRDQALDVYASEIGGQPELVSTGPADSHAEVQIPSREAVSQLQVDVSDDARSVAFESDQQLTGNDTDGSVDVYVRSNGTTSLNSITAFAGNGNKKARLVGLSGDGASVAYLTRERMVETDLDNAETDFFLRTPDFTAGTSAASANVSRKKRGPRTILLSEETTAPKMQLGKRLDRKRSRRITLQLSCPIKEINGPCSGKVALTVGSRKKAAGRKKFRVPAGKTRKLTITVRKVPAAAKKLTVKVVASDRVGNRSTVKRRLHLR